MIIDEQDVREHLARIAAEVRYIPDGPYLLTKGRELRRRRKAAAAAVSAVVLVAALVGVGLPLLLNSSGRPAGPPTVGGPRKLAPLAEVSATPRGWSPVAYRGGQISVPSNWFVEIPPGITCGQHDPGRVFIAESARVPAEMGCGDADNVITIRAAAATAIPHAHTETINGVTVELGWSVHDDQTTYLERGLGLDIGASGPLAHDVLATITHSPLSVVLNSSDLAAPATWRRVTFGGLQFAVPPQWRTEHVSWWGGCPSNLARDVLVLSTAQTLSTPGCPAPLSTAGYSAGMPGMVVGAGPQIHDGHLRGETCRTTNGVRICIDPSPLRAGYPQGRGLQILSASVYLPGQQQPDQIEIGLNGSGLTPAQIFDSIKPER